MPKYVVDTNLYIEATRTPAANDMLRGFFLTRTPEIYLHSVVALELLAGATNPDLERRTQENYIRPLERRGRVLTPSHGAWTRAATVLARLLQRRVVSPNGITRSFLNDCLIAASARDHGFVLVTRNGEDFDRIRDELPIEHIPPWPAPSA